MLFRSAAPNVLQRFESFGINRVHLHILLTLFAKTIESRGIFQTLQYSSEEIQRLAYDLSDRPPLSIVDEHLSRLFCEWAAHPKQEASLIKATSRATIVAIQQLFAAADLSKHADTFVYTRMSPPRKVIMHVGPTNSGKTYHALRALDRKKIGRAHV